MMRCVHDHTTACLRLFVLLLLVPLCMQLAGCGEDYNEIKEKRAKQLGKSDELIIAVVWDRAAKDFMLVEGAQFAVDEQNKKGGLFGRKVRLKPFYAESNEDELQITRRIARDPSISAVMGHRKTNNAITAAILYEEYGMLYLAHSPFKGIASFNYTYRTVPDDLPVSKQIAAFMKSQGFKKIALIDDRSLYGRGVADAIAEASPDEGIEIPVRRFYLPGKTNYKVMSAELVRYTFDAVFIAGHLPHAAEFLRDMRQMGVKQPVMGGSTLDLRALERIAGSASNKIMLPTIIPPEKTSELTDRFFREFKEKYQRSPDVSAVIGYDSVRLVLETVKRSKSTDPVVLASNMQFIREFPGVAGIYSYNLSRALENKTIYFKYLNQTRFVYYDPPVEKKEAPPVIPTDAEVDDEGEEKP